MSFEEKIFDEMPTELSILPYPVCSLYNDLNGNAKLLVTVENGKLYHFNISGTVEFDKITDSNFPHSLYSIDSTYQRPFTAIVSAHDKTDLFLYGGQTDYEMFDGIYQYSQLTRLWAKVGKMFSPRASHTVIPVRGLSCP
jgi:hypothetical protein